MNGLARTAVFLGALLLFLVEPMAARQLLPVFGGSAAVWMTCLVFFQVALLLGYLYAHAIGRASGRGWLAAHLLLVLAAVTSAAVWVLGGGPQGVAEHPIGSIFYCLAGSIGAPFVLLGATGPLVQVWVARVRRGAVPYGLYGLSNVASLLALLAYPVLLEPHLSLRMQRLVWFAGVVAFGCISMLLAGRVAGTTPLDVARDAGERVACRRRRALWFALATVGAMQLSAVTQHLTTNVAAIPLLWVVPLAVYLLTFVVAFQTRVRVPQVVLVGALAVLLVGLGNFLVHPEMGLPIRVELAAFLAELLVACLFCHGALFRLRPAGAAEATGYYLTIAAGGAAGSFLVGMVAPLVFRGNYDLSLVLALTAAVALAVCWHDGTRLRLMWGAGVLVLLVFCVQLRQSYGRSAVMSVRNFYGCLRVTQGVARDGSALRTLLHGTITHGTEIFDAQPQPTTYYAPGSGVGLALTGCCDGRARRVGVVGLGAGSLAVYGRAGDSFRFYELNPAVQPIAWNLFSYLKQTPAQVTFVAGDARASLAAEPAQGFDVLVVDAFSGDAIPLHLLTRQAMAVYRRHLAPGGILAFHVSNQYVDLEPELAALAAADGLNARAITSPAREDRGEFQADWVLMSDGAALRAMDGQLRAPRSRPGVWAWTDDYASLLPLVRW